MSSTSGSVELTSSANVFTRIAVFRCPDPSFGKPLISFRVTQSTEHDQYKFIHLHKEGGRKRIRALLTVIYLSKALLVKPDENLIPIFQIPFPTTTK